MVSPKVSEFFEEILGDDLQTTPFLGLTNFWMVSLKVSDFFEGNSIWWSSNLALSGTSKFFGWSHWECQTFLTANSFIVNGSISLPWLTWEAGCFANFFALFIKIRAAVLLSPSFITLGRQLSFWWKTLILMGHHSVSPQTPKVYLNWS